MHPPLNTENTLRWEYKGTEETTNRKPMNSKEDSELTLHLLSSGRSSSGGSHRHVGGVRCSGCGMGMGSSDCGTVGCLLGLVVVRIAQLGQCRRGHVRRGEGIRIRVPCNGKRAKKRRNERQYVVLYFARPPTLLLLVLSYHAQLLQKSTNYTQGG